MNVATALHNGTIFTYTATVSCTILKRVRAGVLMLFAFAFFLCSLFCSPALSSINAGNPMSISYLLNNDVVNHSPNLPPSVERMRIFLKQFTSSLTLPNSPSVSDSQTSRTMPLADRFAKAALNALSQTNREDLASAWKDLRFSETNFIILFAVNFNQFARADNAYHQVSWVPDFVRSNPVFQAILSGVIPEDYIDLFCVSKIATTAVLLDLHHSLRLLWSSKLPSQDQTKLSNFNWVSNATGYGSILDFKSPNESLLVILAKASLIMNNAEISALFKLGYFSYADIEACLQVPPIPESKVAFKFLLVFVQEMLEPRYFAEFFKMVDRRGYTKDILQVCYATKYFSHISTLINDQVDKEKYAKVFANVDLETVHPALYLYHVENLVFFGCHDVAKKILTHFINVSKKMLVFTFVQSMLDYNFLVFFKSAEVQEAMGGIHVATAILFQMCQTVSIAMQTMLRSNIEETEMGRYLMYQSQQSQLLAILNEIKDSNNAAYIYALKIAYDNFPISFHPSTTLHLSFANSTYLGKAWNELTLNDLTKLQGAAF